MTFTPQKAIPQLNQDQTQDLDPKHFCPIHLPFAPPPCIYYIYTPNLGLVIAVSVRGREQGRSRGCRGEQGEQGGEEGRITEQESVQNFPPLACPYAPGAQPAQGPDMGRLAQPGPGSPGSPRARDPVLPMTLGVN